MKLVFLNGVRTDDGREWTVEDVEDVDDDTATELLAQGVVREAREGE